MKNGLAFGSLGLGLLAWVLPILIGVPLYFLVDYGWVAPVGFFLPVVLGFLAAILGIIGVVSIRRSQGRSTGKGAAIGGILLGLLAAAVGGVFGIVSMLEMEVQKTSESANNITSANNLRNIGTAMHDYHDSVGYLPYAGYLRHEPVSDGKGLSWRVELLNFLEEPQLYDQFHHDEPWDSPHNIKLLPKMPRVYRCPRFETKGDGLTYYRGFTGPGTVLGSTRPFTLGAITAGNGTFYTWLVVEAGEPVPWTKPDELVYAPDRPLPGFGGPQRRDFNALFADAHVQRISANTSESVLRKYITWNVIPPRDQ